MEEKNIFSEGRGIEIVKADQGITVSRSGIEIKHLGKPINFEIPSMGFVYLVIDCSTSMDAGDKLHQAKTGAADFAKDAFRKGYLVGLIKFDSSATHLCEPVKEIQMLGKHLQQIWIGGSTNMAEAIKLARQNLEKKTGPRAMVIVTDGAPDSRTDALDEAQQTKENGIDIITIGTDDADVDFLKKLASRTDLGVKVSREQFGASITAAAKTLPQLGRGKKGGQ